jgi:hypothetical protein
MEASLRLRDTAFPGFVRDISLANIYLTVEGAPQIARNQRVRLDFFLEGAVLQVQGTIAEIRRPPVAPGTVHGQPGLGLVILYSDPGAIEGPILSSLIEELRVQPGCAKLTIFPSLSPNIDAN